MGYSDQNKVKMTVYAVLLLLLLFLERCILNRLPLWGGVPMVLLCASVLVGFWEGTFWGALFGAAAGLMEALSLSGGSEWLIWCYCAVGLVCGTTLDKAFGRTLWGGFLCTLSGVAAVELLQAGARILLWKQSGGAVLPIALGEGLCSVCAFPFLYPLIRTISHRFRTEMEY